VLVIVFVLVIVLDFDFSAAFCPRWRCQRHSSPSTSTVRQGGLSTSSMRGVWGWEGEMVLSPQIVAFRSVETNLLLIHCRTCHSIPFARLGGNRPGIPGLPMFHHPGLGMDVCSAGSCGRRRPFRAVGHCDFARASIGRQAAWYLGFLNLLAAFPRL
jgi:hypothetical protein